MMRRRRQGGGRRAVGCGRLRGERQSWTPGAAESGTAPVEDEVPWVRLVPWPEIAQASAAAPRTGVA